MEENEVRILKAETMDGVIDKLITDNEEKDRAIEEKDKTIKKQIREIMELKKPKSTRFWVKVYKDTDISFLSFRDRGILFSLCQLVGKNKDGYLEDKRTGGLIETWAQLGKNIGIKDNAHTADKCKKLVDKGILIVEDMDGRDFNKNEGYNEWKEAYSKNKARGLCIDSMIKKRHFKLNRETVSVGKDK